MITTTDDLIGRWRALTNDEIGKAETLIADYEAYLHIFAEGKGVDLDAKLENENYKRVFVAVVCDCVANEMVTTIDAPAMSQVSQSALGYSVSGTFLSPGGGLFIRNNQLKELGLLKQKVKQVTLYEDAN